MRVYDGESLKDTDPKAKSYQEYRDEKRASVSRVPGAHGA
jgi:predicted Ser/Thr protein kinase